MELTGRLTADAQVSEVKGGKKVVNFSIAIDDSYKPKDGGRVELTTYIECACPTQQMETTAGTVFGAYNAVTGYFQNVRNYKDGEAKFKSIMDGTAKQRAQTAFDLCRDFAKNGADALTLN
jgi:single-stranded DNA-binding protein